MLDSAKNKSQRKTAITAACTAWNIAVMVPEKNIDDEIDIFFESCVYGTDDRDHVSEIILSMIAKKKSFYSDDMRIIVDFEIVDTKTYFSINVAAMLSS